MAANEAATSKRGIPRERDALPPTYPDHDEASLALIEGLYRTQTGRLMKMLRRRVPDSEEASDMLHEIFARMVRLGGDKLRELERPEAYLTRMTGNLLHDRARRNLPLDQPVELDETELECGVDPVRHLETRDMLARVEAAMERLRPRTRAIFVAHRIHGLSYAEIAEQFGISVKGVEKQMSRAIAQIDRLLHRR